MIWLAILAFMFLIALSIGLGIGLLYFSIALCFNDRQILAGLISLILSIGSFFSAFLAGKELEKRFDRINAALRATE